MRITSELRARLREERSLVQAVDEELALMAKPGVSAAELVRAVGLERTALELERLQRQRGRLFVRRGLGPPVELLLMGSTRIEEPS